MVATEPDLLSTIVAATRRRVEEQRLREPLRSVIDRAERRRFGHETFGAGRFKAALQRADRINVIAECKRRSPSRGILQVDYDPAALAAAYERGGAAAISVLTEPTFFDGSLDHLRVVSERATIPVLRKDFIVDEYQLAEARATGADAVLLIVAALTDADLRQLSRAARQLSLDVLVEVHDVTELDRALAADADLIGVNNRNLRTLAVNTQTAADLIARIPASVVAVAESGFRSTAEIGALGRAGFRAFLVGEWLMTSPDPAATLREIVRVENREKEELRGVKRS